MTATVGSFAPLAPRGAPSPLSSQRRRARLSLFHPGWPFTWFFVGYPVWWLLGLTWLAALIASGVMIGHLFRRHVVPVPGHFGWWLLFLAWVAAGVLLLHVNAPGAVPGGGGTRYLTWGYRLVTFGEATVMLVYLCAMRVELPWTRLSKALGWMFVYIVIGGLLGVIAPFAHFQSLFELLLPRHIALQPFVNSLVQPNFAQIQGYLGVVTTRPSAPFPYANSWGLNYVCFLPFFVAGWWQQGSHRRRVVSVIILLASSVPLVFSLNRAVWGVIAALLLYVAVRGVLRGHVRLALGCILVGCLAGGAVAATPLGNVIQSRLAGEAHTSDQGRTNLGMLTATSALDRSAVAGFGTTRDVQGSFQSIAIGSSPSCPGCSGPALGTQGIVWLLIFAFGFGGFLLYLGFLMLHFIRCVRSRAPAALLASTTLLGYLLTTPFYDLSLTSQVAAFTAIAMVATEGGSANDIRRYTGLIRRQLSVLVVAACCGVLAGGVWQYRRGTPYLASLTIAVAADSTQQHGPRPMSLDTVAQLATGSEVNSSMRRAASATGHDEAPSLQVSAAPISRVLQLQVTARSSAAAGDAVNAAARTLLQMRTQLLTAQQTSKLQRLNTDDDGLWQAIASTSDGIRALKGSAYEAELRNALMTQRSASLETMAKNVDQQVAVALEPVGPGSMLQPATVVRDNQQWTVSLVSGALLGLLAGAITAQVRERKSPRLMKLLRRRSGHELLPPVLAHVQTGRGFLSCRDAVRALERIPSVTCLAVGADPNSRAAVELISRRLSSQAARPTDRAQVALVVVPQCRLRTVRIAMQRLERQNTEICGLIVVAQPASEKYNFINGSRTSVRAFTTPSRGSADDDCRQQ